MAGDTRKFPPAGYLFEIPGAEDLQHLSAFFVYLFSQYHDLLFLLLHIVLMAFDAIPIQFFGHIGKLARGISKLAARMTAVTEGAGDALSVNLILLPEFVGHGMTSLTFRGMGRRVADENKDKIDDEK